MVQTGYNVYKRNLANTGERKEQILLKLYKGAINFIQRAQYGIQEKSPKIKGESISNVLAIITELDCALDHKIGGELAENLSSLYQYMMMRLTMANIHNDNDILEEIKGLLTELNTGFEQALQIQDSNSNSNIKPISQESKTERSGGLSFAI